MNSDNADFDYDGMVQNALRGVVRDILADVAVNGLKGDHHYYVAFATGEDGVSLPAYLKERYPTNDHRPPASVLGVRHPADRRETDTQQHKSGYRHSH